MACVGGTIEEPRVWYRLVGDTLVEQSGRACLGYAKGVKGRGGERRSRFTSVYSCSTCIAYRGPLKVRPRGSVEPVPYIGALYPDGKIHNLTAAEFEAQFDYDEIEEWFDSLDPALRSPMTTASSESSRNLDDEARAVWNEYHRRYREEHPEIVASTKAGYRQRNRARLAQIERERRAKKRGDKAVQVGGAGQPQPIKSSEEPRARARGMDCFIPTEGSV